jgi:hypothetical protein
MVKYSPRTSALYREIFQEKAAWSPTEHLLQSLVDIEADRRWREFGGPKAGKRPNPGPRPGETPKGNAQTFGSPETAVPESEFWARWNEGLETPERPEIDEEDGGV